MAFFRNSGRRNIICSICLGLFSFISIAATCDDFGWTWDEVYYFLSSELQIEWFQALRTALVNGSSAHVLSQKIIDEYWLWDINHNPHPPLYKILSSISLMLFKNSMDEFTAYRLATALLAGILVAFVFHALKTTYGLLPGLYGALSLLAMPLFFGHAHIAATEIPLALFWLCSYWAFWQGLTRFAGSALLAVFFGCALATKFTAVLIPAAAVIWTVLYREKRAFRNIIALMVSPFIAVLLNPGWWYQPLHKISDFIQISMSRHDSIPISTFFAGIRYSFSPPWYYAPVMTVITIPVTILLPVLLGVVLLLCQRFKNSCDILFLLNIPCIFAVVMLPQAPVHDGIRQFFSLLPFLAYLSGMGFHYIALMLSGLPLSDYIKKTLIVALGIGCLTGAGYQIWRCHPYELSYYNALVGGLRGAYAKGMEITYWFEGVNKKFLGEFNRRVPDGSRICMWPANPEYFQFLQSRGKIKDTVIFYKPTAAIMSRQQNPAAREMYPDYFILIPRLSEFTALHRKILADCIPLIANEFDGVPLVLLYRW